MPETASPRTSDALRRLEKTSTPPPSRSGGTASGKPRAAFSRRPRERPRFVMVDPASERHREAPHRPCPAAARCRTSWPAGGGCRATASSGSPGPTTPASPPRWWSSASSRERAIDRRELGREKFLERVWEWKERVRRHDPGAAPAAGLLAATGPRALHPRRGPLARGAGGLRAALPRGADLPRPLHGQLVPALRHGGLRPRGRAPEANAASSDRIRYDVPGARAGASWSPRPARRRCWATRRWRSIPRTDATAHLRGQDGDPADRRPASCRSSRTRSWSTASSAPASVKVTPAHDPNDFEVGRGGTTCPAVVVIGPDGRMTPRRRAFAGLDRFEARKRGGRAPRAAEGRLVEAEDHELQRRASASAAATVIEPLLSTQWFVQGPAAGASPPSGPSRDGDRPLRAGVLGEDLLRLAGEHPRLVHLAPALVGPPDPGLLLRERPPVTVADEDPDGLRDLRLGRAGAGPGRARHLVLLGALALLDPRLARGDGGPAALLPDRRAGDRLRHPLLLGGADDHDGPPLHRPGAVLARSTCTAWCATRRREDVEDQGQRDRSARSDRGVRRRRACASPSRSAAAADRRPARAERMAG